MVLSGQASGSLDSAPALLKGVPNSTEVRIWPLAPARPRLENPLSDIENGAAEQEVISDWGEGLGSKSSKVFSGFFPSAILLPRHTLRARRAAGSGTASLVSATDNVLGKYLDDGSAKRRLLIEKA
jgi:hypothetical protein